MYDLLCESEFSRGGLSVLSEAVVVPLDSTILFVPVIEDMLWFLDERLAYALVPSKTELRALGRGGWPF